MDDEVGEIATEVAEEVVGEVRRFLEKADLNAWVVGLGPVLAYNAWRIATGRPALSQGYDEGAQKYPIPVYGATAYMVFHLAVAKHVPSRAKRYVQYLDVLSLIATLIRMAADRSQATGAAVS